MALHISQIDDFVQNIKIMFRGLDSAIYIKQNMSVLINLHTVWNMFVIKVSVCFIF